MKKIYAIAAIDEENGIGKSNQLPWVIPQDLKYFKKTSSETKDPKKVNAVIMGRKTWESIPETYRPMPGRKNIVLSRSKDIELPEGVILANSIEESIEIANQLEEVESIFITGGGVIYSESIQKSIPDEVLITRISGTHNCDAFFPEIPDTYSLKSETETFTQNGHEFKFQTYTKQNH